MCFFLCSWILLILVLLWVGEGRMEVWYWCCGRQTLIRGLLRALRHLAPKNDFSWVLCCTLTRRRHGHTLEKAWVCKECCVSLAIADSGRFLACATQFGLFGRLRLPDVELSGRRSSSFWWFFFSWRSLLDRCRFSSIWRRTSVHASLSFSLLGWGIQSGISLRYKDRSKLPRLWGTCPSDVVIVYVWRSWCSRFLL